MSEIKKTEDIFLKLISSSKSLEELESIRIRALGKKGEVSNLMKSIGLMEEKERKIKAPLLNALKDKIIENLEKKKNLINEDILNKRISSEWIDISRPVRPAHKGKIHPISQVTEEIVEIFSDLGFSIAEGPQIESDWYNFDALNIPPEHPARQEFDTFYVKHNNKNVDEPNVLRTHTSPVQIRHMEKTDGVPCRIIVPGKVFRSDYDQTHTPMFNQLEGLAIDKDINMSHLKWTLEEFCRTFFDIDDVVSSMLKLVFSLALQKFEAVISGCKEPILFTTSPIKASKFFLLPILDNFSISFGLLIPVIRLDKPCNVPPPTDIPPRWLNSPSIDATQAVPVPVLTAKNLGSLIL